MPVVRVNQNFEADWTDEQWAALVARHPRRWLGVRVVKVADEAEGSAYLSGSGRRRSLAARFADKYLY